MNPHLHSWGCTPISQTIDVFRDDVEDAVDVQVDISCDMAWETLMFAALPPAALGKR
jgi:hypothetical protein